jgi:Tol biopolymer transport system component
VIKADRSQPRRLTQDQAEDLQPAGSPDGTGQRRLTNNAVGDWEACWSPDGEWIVYVSGSLEDTDLYVMRVDREERYRLTRDVAPQWTPSWQP